MRATASSRTWWAPTPTQRLLHPLRDRIDAHLIERPDGTFQALTEIGRFHLERLHLYRAELVAHRLLHRRIAEDRAAIRRLEAEAHALAKRLDALEQALRDS